MQIKKIIINILVIFGILFLSLLGHELTHIFQSKAPVSICYDFQQISLMHIYHNTTKICEQEFYSNSSICNKELDKWLMYTEKCAYLVEYLILIILSMFIGFLLKDKNDKLR